MHPALLILLCIANPASLPGESPSGSMPTTLPSTTATTQPNCADLCEQGRDALRAGRFAEAVALLESAVASDPTSLAARTLLVDAFRKAARPEQAAEQLARIGEWQAKAGRHALAAQTYRESLAMHSNPAVHCALAETYCLLDQALGPVTARVMPNAEPGRRMDGHYVLQPDQQRAGWFLTCSDESAVYQVQAALDTGLDTPEVHRLHARVWLLAGRPERAVAILHDREDRLPERESGEFWHWYGQAALAADDLETSARCLKQAVMWNPARFQPTLAEAYQTLADRYSRRGDLPAYVGCLEQAGALAPRDADLRYRLGNAYWEAGRLADAARQWQVTLELDPDHPQRLRLLEQLRQAASAGEGTAGPPPGEARD